MIQSVTTFSRGLDIVLLGSGLSAGLLEWGVLCVLAVAWLAFGVWLLRNPVPGRRGLMALLYFIAGSGLAAAVLARDAPLFYSGVALTGYGTVALLLMGHGSTHVRTAAAQVTLMVLGDLLLFELFVSLYSQTSSAEFSGLRTAYADKGQGVSFMSGLLVATGGTRVAVLLLLLPVFDRLPAWRPGAVSGLACVAFVAGVLPVARLIDPLLSSVSAGYTLLAILGSAVVLCLLVVMCVLGKSRIDALAFRVSNLASRAVATGVTGLGLLEALAQRIAPIASALEQRMLSWPVAISAAATLALLLALSFGGFPA